eukprot:COSAG02_NODE_1867_length_10594_cov_221.941591_7_plen_168_part_00
MPGNNLRTRSPQRTGLWVQNVLVAQGINLRLTMLRNDCRLEQLRKKLTCGDRAVLWRVFWRRTRRETFDDSIIIRVEKENHRLPPCCFGIISNAGNGCSCGSIAWRRIGHAMDRRAPAIIRPVAESKTVTTPVRSRFRAVHVCMLLVCLGLHWSCSILTILPLLCQG